MNRAPSDTDLLATRIAAGDRTALARAITLVESTRSDHRTAATALLDMLAERTGRSIRIGMTGVPGVGKSTLIDGFGTMLTALGHRVAVLAVDPTSVRSGGAILGDKTRMARLATDPAAFVRPSPSSGTLGGVAAKTRETMLLCEAAGFDVVIVETVGVGQSEITVADMVDLFVLLMLPGAGDELQGIKKGIVEVADIIAVNKADGENARRARLAAAELRAALNILGPRDPLWSPPVLTLSGQTGEGLAELWSAISRFCGVAEGAGTFAGRRAGQNVRWMWTMLDEALRRALLDHDGVAAAIAEGEADIVRGIRAPTAVAQAILQLFTAR
ncbi:methylmalonyl Co-A mutase-associated GTPase MeaB [Aureimonas sp. SA4125]|uniref:methylmalonyl Co-A mutase-associated GTPase MeaB n=1 Tax=Aureimonas sp. SA4125 TaxID=2826993 RepID=UPI001CC7C542|nr:methylmalonyl Co-A mutase-associated GTPase MeaB [Aureimonas sp. SA4125]